MSGAATLSTARLVLRPLDTDHVDAAHALWTDADVRRYLWDDHVIPRERAAEMLASSVASFTAHGFGLWGLEAFEGGPFVGFCGALPTATGEVELLYGLYRSHWGHGLASEAAGAVLDHVFDTLGRPEVVASTDVPNLASTRVLEGLGMTFDRRAAQHGLDLVYYRLTADDWRQRRIVVRRATPADEPLLLSLTPRLADFPHPPWRTALEIDRSDHAVLLEALHHPGPQTCVLVAERPAGAPGGMALVTTQIDYFTKQPHPHLETLVVSAAMEGQGLARALLDAAEGWARLHGHGHITLTAFDGNRKARAVYERRGYLAETVTMRKPLAVRPADRAPWQLPAGLVVRADTPADADALWDVLQPVIAAGDTYAYPPDMSRADALEAWHPRGGYTFVAELDGRVAGTYVLKPNQPGVGSHVANCGYMVAPWARGRGLGEALCRHSLDAARALGYEAMQFNSVVSTNRTAIAVWQRCGFSIVGTVPQAFAHPTEGLVDIHVMHRFL